MGGCVCLLHRCVFSENITTATATNPTSAERRPGHRYGDNTRTAAASTSTKATEGLEGREEEKEITMKARALNWTGRALRHGDRGVSA